MRYPLLLALSIGFLAVTMTTTLQAQRPPYYPDVNGDEAYSPRDALSVIPRDTPPPVLPSVESMSELMDLLDRLLYLLLEYDAMGTNDPACRAVLAEISRTLDALYNATTQAEITAAISQLNQLIQRLEECLTHLALRLEFEEWMMPVEE